MGENAQRVSATEFDRNTLIAWLEASFQEMQRTAQAGGRR
jgi:hypothetical protein